MSAGEPPPSTSRPSRLRLPSLRLARLPRPPRLSLPRIGLPRPAESDSAAAAAAAVPSSRRIAGLALMVMALLLVGRVFGVLDDVVKANLFGTRDELGAYIAAFQLPELLNNLISGGALAAAFIPVFAGLLARGDRAAAWRLASNVLNFTFLITLVCGLIIVAAAPWLAAHVVVPGYAPELQALTAGLMRFIVVSMVLFSISGIAFSVLNAHQHFLLPALAPICYNVGVVGGAILLAPRYGVWGLAYGAVAGMLFNVLIQLPGLRHYGMRWQLQLDWRDPLVRQVFALMLPRMAGVAVIYLNVLVGTALASEIPYEGAVAALSFGWRIQQVPATIIGLGIGGVLFPSLAALAAEGQVARLRATFSWGLRVLILLTVPAAAALVLLGRHAIGVVLRGGSFGEASTESVMAALQFYAVGLVGYSALEIVARALFAQRDTRTPFFVACGALVANGLLGLTLRAPLGHGGLALAQSLAVSAEVLVLLAVLRRRLGGVDGRALAATFARALVAAGAMALAIGATLGAAAPLTAAWPERLALLAQVGLASLAGLAVYLAVAFALGSAELRALPGLLRRRAELPAAEPPAEPPDAGPPGAQLPALAVADRPAEAQAD